ncbi:DUF3558 domain-containing protein [Halocatena marina]|uniref:DUF3558 domain-containing protein n=1 Tax=Halocatena marina TaxID=2934937 RepID=UPI00200EDA2A|nr:DUF3558 domain-containing protein [Halocatena marina]
MSRRVPLSLGLVCLLVLAGCSGFGGSLRTSPSPTISPADVPTDRTPTTPQNQLAPGVLPSGVYNASALAAAHNRTLTNTSFTIRTNVTVTSPNGTVVTSYRSVSRINTTRPRRDVGQTRYRTAPVYVQGVPPVTTETWAGPNVSLQRYTFANNTTAIEERHWQANTGAAFIETSFRDAQSTVQRVGERNGTVLYRITAPISPKTSVPLIDNDTVNSSQTLLVDEHGLVHNQQLQYSIRVSRNSSKESDTTMLTRHINSSFLKIGTSSVEQPAWVKQWNSTNETSTNSRLESIIFYRFPSSSVSISGSSDSGLSVANAKRPRQT